MNLGATLGEMLKGLLHSNQFASGGLLLMLVGAIGASARKVPTHIYTWLWRRVNITVTVKDDDAVFGWIKFWFVTQKFTQKSRNIDLDTHLTGGISLLPAPGDHWFWWKRRLFHVHFERQLNQSGGGYGASTKRTETFTFTVFSRKRDVIRFFVEDITRIHRERSKVIPRMYHYEGSYWEEAVGYTPRELASVILPKGHKEVLLQDINTFLNSQERYNLLGIPYHRGYLFHGPPGTGKSSLVTALAGHLNMSVYIIQLNEFNDKNLAEAMIKVPAESVILFEDIDAMNTAVKQRPEEQEEDDGTTRMANKFGVTLSGLLNVLDGVDAPSGVLYMMTTNRQITLDPALVRPGRVDKQIYLGPATTGQKVEMYGRFFPSDASEAEVFIEDHDECVTMAEFQGALIMKDAEMSTDLCLQ